MTIAHDVKKTQVTLIWSFWNFNTSFLDMTEGFKGFSSTPFENKGLQGWCDFDDSDINMLLLK